MDNKQEEAVELFEQLSPEAQERIISIVKDLLSKQ